MDSQNLKHFQGSIGGVIKQAERIMISFLQYLAELQAAYPLVFTAVFVAMFTEHLRQVCAIPTDRALRGYQVTKTAAIKGLVTRFAVLYVKLKASVVKAFPDDASIRREFGIGRKSEILSRVEYFYAYLRDFVDLRIKYGAALLAAGCSAALLDEFATLQADLAEQVSMQGLAINGRHVFALDRKTLVNRLWADLVEIENHANATYGEGSAKASLFKLDRGTKAKAPDVVPKPKKAPKSAPAVPPQPAPAGEPDLPDAA